MSIFTKIFGDSSQTFIKNAQPQVERINVLAVDFEGLSDGALKEKTQQFRRRLASGEAADSLLHEAFAAVREAARRQLRQRHFDVQLVGGMALHQGKIAEMRTGEGKTLTATLAVYLNALAGKGAHVVTVNDYLAKRDMVWMGQIYDALGLSTGCITNAGGYRYDPEHRNSKLQAPNYKQIPNSNDPNGQNDSLDEERDTVGGFKVVEDYLRPCSRQEAYGADITYGTNHEFGFDYLRDNMVYDAGQRTQRGHFFAVVDEVDSILIDEARVPLIISGQAEDASDAYRRFTRVVDALNRDEDYTVDEKLKAASFTEQGQDRVVRSLGMDPWGENDITMTHQLESALKAKALFLRDRDYVVKNGEVMIIDEFTGRILQGRRWSQGLHQAVEAKEGVRIQPESTTLATITFQNYFRLYEKLSGMTGTAITSAEEFDKVYGLDIVAVPTNRPIARQDLEDNIYKTEEGKMRSLVREIRQRHETGQPILIGTRSVEKNEFMARLLSREGIRHEVLNAKNHEREGEIIAQAGRRGAVTVATNMAGRGVDIVLGGNPPDAAEAEAVRRAGGLHVIGTERHEARRIDNQLRGRAGRQGDPGSTQFFVSLEDDLMRIFGGERIKGLMDTMRVPDDEPIHAKMISNALESAQGKIEGFNFDARKHLLEYDDVMNKHREIVYKKRRAFLENPEFPVADFSAAAENLEKKKQELGEAQFNQMARFVALRVIDNLWQEHLSNMEHLRESVKLRAYGGRDPLVEYKGEGRGLFQQLLAQIDFEIADNITRAGAAPAGAAPTANLQLPTSNSQSVGRNDPCPCGAVNPETGKPYKYKNCGLINAPYHKG